jgi:hypothetical protein
MQIERRTANRLTTVRRVLRVWLQPEVLKPPATDQNLSERSALERSVESIKYSILSLEFWISPDGVLRQWLRFNLRVAGLIAIPTITLVPAVTLLLSQFTVWTGFLVQMALNLALGVMWIMAAVALVSLLVMVIQRLTSK